MYTEVSYSKSSSPGHPGALEVLLSNPETEQGSVRKAVSPSCVLRDTEQFPERTKNLAALGLGLGTWVCWAVRSLLGSGQMGLAPGYWGGLDGSQGKDMTG